MITTVRALAGMIELVGSSKTGAICVHHGGNYDGIFSFPLETKTSNNISCLQLPEWP
jgi:hypothetical protein